MSERDMRRLERMAEQGNSDAALILEMIEAAKRIPESIDDMALAMGIKRDHDEILAGVMEDMIGAVLPTLLKMSGAWAMPESGGFESLRWHLSINQMLDLACFNHKQLYGKLPASITLSNRWKANLEKVATYTYEETPIPLKYATWHDTTRLDLESEKTE